MACSNHLRWQVCQRRSQVNQTNSENGNAAARCARALKTAQLAVAADSACVC
eukprot:m.248863 g.248863  ORF g.248863 m.248863 type:complete len:52 (-) comp15873_c0_seq3:148-303(-)